MQSEKRYFVARAGQDYVVWDRQRNRLADGTLRFPTYTDAQRKANEMNNKVPNGRRKKKDEKGG